MNRIISASLLLWLTLCPIFAQQSKPASTLTEEQWQVLLTALGNEDWSAAAEYSLKYMKQLKEADTENALPRLRYMFIFATAGKATEGKMSQEDLKMALKDFIGQEVETPGRRISADCQGGNESMNAICPGKDYDLTMTGTNNRGTSIFAFEYVRLKERFDFARYQGQWAMVKGFIKTFNINSSVLKIWVLRIFLEGGQVTLEK
jgi:hypothetical protein